MLRPGTYCGLLVAFLFIAFGLLILLGTSGCAVESPRIYVKIPQTGCSAYVYGGAGIVADPDAATLAR